MYNQGNRDIKHLCRFQVSLFFYEVLQDTAELYDSTRHVSDLLTSCQLPIPSSLTLTIYFWELSVDIEVGSVSIALS